MSEATQKDIENEQVGRKISLVKSEETILSPPLPKVTEPSHLAKNIILGVLFLVGLSLTIWAHRALSASAVPNPIPLHPQRIITLAPSVTETVFAVGLGPEVRGVTTFCHYPPEVENLPRVAGFSDVNIEAILRLRPDLVILPVDKVETQVELTRLGITVMPMDTRTLAGLMEAIRTLGTATGHKVQAMEVLGRLQQAIDFARKNAQGKDRPKVLFSVMHSYAGFGHISELTIAGKDGFFDHLIDICGGVNAYQGSLPFPTLSREAIININPDVIIDLLRSSEEVPDALASWKSLTNVSAIKNKRLYLFTQEADTVPGPRAYRTIRKVALAIHPDGTDLRYLEPQDILDLKDVLASNENDILGPYVLIMEPFGSDGGLK
ncbi:MAG: helical backbone metal receptor [Deltaproteobacteria bacterium]|jgi:iron complex transport system substrate-binding protein|nr:helical backbone metal receptor [Deltaproteobacteria bacterium]